jgi:hypothetical protein
MLSLRNTVLASALLIFLTTTLNSPVAHADFTGQPLPSPTPGQTTPPAPHSKSPDAQLKDFLFENPAFLMTAIGLKVSQKCVSYFEAVPNCEERVQLQQQCLNATALLIRNLDVAPSHIQDQKVVISFHTELMGYVKNPAIQALLKNFVADDTRDLVYLKEQLALLPNAPTWIDFVAVLFQDVLPSHLNYVESQLTPAQQPFMYIYNRANRKFYDLLYNDDQRALVSPDFIPPEREYHYFVIRSLSERIARQGVDPAVASFVSFLFNYVYKVEELIGPVQVALTEPATITQPVIIDDIYKGYLGAYAHQKKLDSASFFSLFATDTRKGLKTVATHSL